jgi:hypothetical protein
MKKIIVFTVLLSVLAGAAVFAAGGQEDDYGYGPRYEDRWEGYGGEIITITGTVKLEGERHPELEAADGTYELMYPPFLDDGLDVKVGDKITVEGYLVPGPRWGKGDEESEELFLHVTKAVIDGKEYVVEHRGPRHGGRRGGMAYGGPGCFRDGGRFRDDGRRDSRSYGRR